MKKIFILLSILLSNLSNDVNAQLPDTDIFLFKANTSSNKLSFGPAINITNRPGYDNQPCFSPDGSELLFVSIADSTQSDIWSYNLRERTKKQITNTKESEYSPTYIRDGKKISTVRVDTDSAQRFYVLDYPEATNAQLIRNTDSIGYSCWVNDSLIAMFVVGEKNTLQLLDLSTNKRTFIADEPGRCLKIHPKNKLLYFVDKSDSTNWYLTTYNIKTGVKKRLLATLPGSEDFAFFSNGLLICGYKGGIFKLTSGEKKAWIAIGEPIISMENDFYRIAISPDDKYIAVVSFKGKKP